MHWTRTKGGGIRKHPFVHGEKKWQMTTQTQRTILLHSTL
jgi:hypothetical protein